MINYLQFVTKNLIILNPPNIIPQMIYINNSYRLNLEITDKAGIAKEEHGIKEADI